MGVLESIGKVLADAAAKIHINVLSGNKTSDSPKLTIKQKTDNSDRRQVKYVDKSTNYYLTLPSGIGPDSIPDELRPLLDAYQRKQITFVAEEQQLEVSAVLSFEQDADIKSLLKFFKGKLSERDHILLRSGLYLKHLRTRDPEEAKRQWNLIKINNSPRDRRIINLAGADYFHTYFRALYKELAEQGEPYATQQFRRTFDRTIQDMQFVIFVDASMDENDVIHRLNEKVQRNIRYGVRDEVIYIHGAGNSVDTIEKAVKELRSRKTFRKIQTTKKDSGASGRVIKAGVYYREDA